MMARNEKKMQEKLQEIKTQCGRSIETKYIIADFSKLVDVSQYRECMDPVIKDLDIGMVCVNAGWSCAGKYIEISDGDLRGNININLL